jgi:hypothetical protein
MNTHGSDILCVIISLLICCAVADPLQHLAVLVVWSVSGAISDQQVNDKKGGAGDTKATELTLRGVKHAAEPEDLSLEDKKNLSVPKKQGCRRKQRPG